MWDLNIVTGTSFSIASVLTASYQSIRVGGVAAGIVFGIASVCVGLGCGVAAGIVFGIVSVCVGLGCVIAAGADFGLSLGAYCCWSTT